MPANQILVVDDEVGIRALDPLVLDLEFGRPLPDPIGFIAGAN